MGTVEDEAEGASWSAPGPGRWNREVAHFPDGQTPLYRSVYQPESAAGLRDANERYGIPASTLQTAHVNHRLYARVVPLLEPPARLSASAPPRPAVWLLPRLVPRFRARTAAARRAWSLKLWRVDGERWYREDGPAFEAANLRLQDETLDGLSDEGLADHVGRAVEHLGAGLRTHFFLVGAHIAPLGHYLAFARECGLTGEQALNLVQGASPASAEGARGLEPVAHALTSTGAEPKSWEDLRGLGPEASAALDAWLRRYGNRVVSGYDVDQPRLCELPGLVVATVVALARNRPEAGVGADAEPIRAAVPRAAREQFDELLEEARYGYGIRDANAGITLQWPAGLVRRAVLAAGERLVQVGRVERAGDLFHASPTELQDLIRGGGPSGRELRHRADERAAQLRQPAPDHLGPEEPLPPVDPLPAPLRRSARAALLTYELMNSDAARAPGTGTGIGTDVVCARARVATDAAEALASVQPGEILVVPATTPTYNAVLPLVAGLVVEEGGALSHAALVARELGIPAVIGLRGATWTFPNGALLELDPTAGSVRLVGPPTG